MGQHELFGVAQFRHQVVLDVGLEVLEIDKHWLPNLNLILEFKFQYWRNLACGGFSLFPADVHRRLYDQIPHSGHDVEILKD